MAMTFTIVSHLREQLSTLIRTRSGRRKKEALELERKALEVGPRLRVLSLIHPIYIVGRGSPHSGYPSDDTVIQGVENYIR
jgi:hypothetical protein